MVRLRKRGEQIRQFILENVESNPQDIVAITAQKFGVSRQAVNIHTKNLVKQEALVSKGTTRNKHYLLHPQEEWEKLLLLTNSLQEDVIWRNEIKQEIGQLPDNVVGIWNYGFTEMFNNVVDHSQGTKVLISIKKTAYSTKMDILDDGIGIFNKIKNDLGLLDERHAAIELTKGKLTTDPTRHTGEGIFFTSRMFDEFSILSGEVYLSHQYGTDEDWMLQTRENSSGTYITMKLKNNSSRTTKEIQDKFASDDDYGFTKTIVPVRLAQYGNEQLVSRSQAKRLLIRIDRFKTVLFDFKEVESIGPAFADEVFRVFAKQHPHMELIPINANEAVTQVINRVRSIQDETIAPTNTQTTS